MNLNSFTFSVLVFSHLISFALSTTCSSGQYLLLGSQACVESCPSGYFETKQSSQLVCKPQTLVNTRIRSTPQERIFILVFSSTSPPFSTNQELLDNMNLTTTTSEGHTTFITGNSANFLDDEGFVVQVSANLQSIPPGSTLAIAFPRYSEKNSTNSISVDSTTLQPNAYSALSNGKVGFISALTDLDTILEIVWTSVAIFNPYGLLYMNAKFYRESADLLKQVNVNSEGFLASFFKYNNNKVSGLKLPNLAATWLYGSPATSGWDRRQEVAPQYTTLSPSRVQDLKLTTLSTLYEVEPFCLFLDNYGIQLTVLGAFLVILGILEVFKLAFKPSKNETQMSNEFSIFQTLKVTFRWNFCIALVIGSYQSLCYYTLVQIQAFFSENNDKTGHNLIGFLTAIFVFLGLGLGFPGILLYRIKQVIELKKNRVLASEHYNYEALSTYYGIFCKFLKMDSLHYPVFILVLLVRSFFFAVLVLFASDSPGVQLGLMMGISLIFIVYLLVLWPFKNFIFNLLQCLYEAILFAILSNMLWLSTIDDSAQETLHRQIVSYVILFLYLALPIINTIAGVSGVLIILLRPLQSKNKVTRIAPEPEAEAEAAPEPGSKKKEEDEKEIKETTRETQETHEAKKEEKISNSNRDYIASALTTTTVDQLTNANVEEKPMIPSIEEVLSEKDEENSDLEDPRSRPTVKSTVIFVQQSSRKYFF